MIVGDRSGERGTAFSAALAQAGRLGRDLLAVDWSATPLGAIDSWPESLRTVVRILVSSRFSMWMAWGPELTFLCNDAYRRDTLGTKYPWALGRAAREVWEEIWPDIGPRIETVLATGEATWDQSLLLFLERSGYREETYHTFSYSPLADEQGRIAGMLCVVSEDTERVIGERRMATLRDLGNLPGELRDEQAFLEASARALAANPRSLPFTAVYLFDEQEDARFAASTGFDAGHPAAPAAIGHDEPEPVWPARELRDGAPALVIEGIDGRFERLPTGAWDRPPARALALPLADPAAGRPLGFLLVGVNPLRPLDDGYRTFAGLIAQRLAAGVSSARAYAHERRRAEELAALDRAKTEFFSNVSHEFRTPLTLMLAPLQDALAAEEALDGEQLELVQRSGLRLLKLVNMLLDFSRLEAGRLQGAFRPTDVAELTGELAGTFRDACQRAGIELVVELEALDQPAYVDPDLWERIVLNLLSNAFKVTLEGRISVRVSAVPGGVSLSVSDTGPGISDEDQQRVFERFARVSTPHARSHEGSGIGLALVSELVALHGGGIALDSTPGLGASFTVTIPYGSSHLPAAQVSEEPASTVPGVADLFAQEALSWLPAADFGRPPANAAGTGARSRLDTSGSRILVADDNPDLRRYLIRLLSPFWQVDSAADGRAAIEAIRADPPDLLITDVMMPELDGFGLLAELRSAPEPRLRELPVVMLSARAGEEASIEGLDAGADDYLPKPFSGRELLARVRSHLELSLVRGQAAEQLRTERLLLEQTLRQLPAGVIMCDARSWRIALANAHVPGLAGVAEPAADGEPYVGRALDEALSPVLAERLRDAIESGEAIGEQDAVLRAQDGRRMSFRFSAAPITDPGGTRVAGVIVIQDVTARVRDQQLQAAGREVMAMIARREPLAEILARITAIYGRLSDRGGRALIAPISHDGSQFLAPVGPDFPAAFLAAIEGVPIAPTGTAGRAVHGDKTVVVADTLADRRWAEHRELALEHRLRAAWSTPMHGSDRRPLGTFTVYHEFPAVPTTEEQQLVVVLCGSAAVALERERDVRIRERQLDELQRSLLPPQLPEIEGLAVAATFRPGDRSLDVGGDFYDVFRLPGGGWGFVIGDVCGHGAQAAAVTGLTRHSIRAIAALHEAPGQVLAHTSELLLASGFDRYCTAIHGHLTRERAGSWAVTLAIAGHPPALIRRAGGRVEALTEHGRVLGLTPGTSYPQISARLTGGDALLLHTDGLIERNPRLAGECGLRALIGRLAPEPAPDMLAQLERAALGPEPARDDIAILLITVP